MAIFQRIGDILMANINDLIDICGEEGKALGFFGESSIASDKPADARS